MTTADKAGKEPKGASKPRRFGIRSAQNRYTELLAGRTLTPEADALLKLTSRLITLSTNVSNELFAKDADDDALPLLRELRELGTMIKDNLAVIFPADAGSELLGKLRS